MENDTRRCKKCGELKAVEEFPTWIDRQYGDERVRVRQKCKPCWNSDKKTWRQKNQTTVKAQKKRHYEKHKDRLLERTRQWRERNDLYDVERFLWQGFGMTLDEYDALLESQDGVCAICGKPEQGDRYKRLAVDHDHDTGKNRGLLCQRCNRGLGLLQDDVGLLQSAIEYLRKYHKET